METIRAMSKLACIQVPLLDYVKVHNPCASPKAECISASSGPGCGYLGNIPYTNAQVHVVSNPTRSSYNGSSSNKNSSSSRPSSALTNMINIGLRKRGEF